MVSNERPAKPPAHLAAVDILDDLGPAERVADDILASRRDLLPSVEPLVGGDRCDGRSLREAARQRYRQPATKQ